MTQTKVHNVAALDVGDKRVGVAMTNTIARIPRPVKTLIRDQNFWDSLKELFREESIKEVVIGLPRNMNSQDTGQTALTRSFIEEFKEIFDIPVATQDEALTSIKAEKELAARGKKFDKGDIDALAAAYILEDYLNERTP